MALAADQGHELAQMLSVSGFPNSGMNDCQRILPVLQKLASHGNAEAMARLGILYNGGGCEIPKDFHAAQFWLLKAIEAGYGAAATRLGYSYGQGRDIEEDQEAALRYYRIAANSGDAEAQNELGVMLAEGTGVAEDQEEAVAWFTKGAAQGNLYAAANLGLHYVRGHGVPQDYKRVRFGSGYQIF